MKPITSGDFNPGTSEPTSPSVLLLLKIVVIRAVGVLFALFPQLWAFLTDRFWTVVVLMVVSLATEQAVRKLWKQ
jgi:hypothetical protein